jgi:hypothetical protein
MQSSVDSWSYGSQTERDRHQETCPVTVVGALTASPAMPAHSRARSLISNEQQRTLKSFYSTNTRPSAAELDRLAADAGLAKRVVQVLLIN